MSSFKVEKKSDTSYASKVLGERAESPMHEAAERPYLEAEEGRLFYIRGYSGTRAANRQPADAPEGDGRVGIPEQLPGQRQGANGSRSHLGANAEAGQILCQGPGRCMRSPELIARCRNASFVVNLVRDRGGETFCNCGQHLGARRTG